MKSKWSQPFRMCMIPWTRYSRSVAHRDGLSPAKVTGLLLVSKSPSAAGWPSRSIRTA